MGLVFPSQNERQSDAGCGSNRYDEYGRDAEVEAHFRHLCITVVWQFYMLCIFIGVLVATAQPHSAGAQSKGGLVQAPMEQGVKQQSRLAYSCSSTATIHSVSQDNRRGTHTDASLQGLVLLFITPGPGLLPVVAGGDLVGLVHHATAASSASVSIRVAIRVPMGAVHLPLQRLVQLWGASHGQ